jgi:hypothetical protein
MGITNIQRRNNSVTTGGIYNIPPPVMLRGVMPCSVTVTLFVRHSWRSLAGVTSFLKMLHFHVTLLVIPSWRFQLCQVDCYARSTKANFNT